MTKVGEVVANTKLMRPVKYPSGDQTPSSMLLKYQNKMSKILICGDSFAADWTVKYEGKGWPNLLAEKYEVTNLAQAGCGQYKILKQLQKSNLDDYDVIIVTHTSPNRIYVEKHPVHCSDSLHKNCDLIYTDIKSHSESNQSLASITDFYEKYFSEEYAEFVHTMIQDKISSLLFHYDNVIHLNFFKNGRFVSNKSIDFYNLKTTTNNAMNHFDIGTNKMIFDKVMSRIKIIIE